MVYQVCLSVSVSLTSVGTSVSSAKLPNEIRRSFKWEIQSKMRQANFIWDPEGTMKHLLYIRRKLVYEFHTKLLCME